MDYVELKQKLKSQGYDIQIALGRIYLSADREYILNKGEAIAIAQYTDRYGKLENFSPYMEKNGLNHWLNRDRLFLSGIEKEILQELNQEFLDEAIASLKGWESFDDRRKERLARLAYEVVDMENPRDIFFRFSDEVLHQIERENPEYQRMMVDALRNIKKEIESMEKKS